MKDENISWPCELPTRIRTALLSSAQLHVLDTDDCLVLGKGNMNGLFYVMQGLVVAGIPNLVKSCPFVVFKAGDWFGGTVIYNGADFQYRIASIECSKIIFIPNQVIRDTAESNPEIFKLLYLVTSERTRSALEMLFASSGMVLKQKVAYFLLEVSKRFPHVSGSKAMISMSQTMLAQMLGLSRLTLNQQLHLLEQESIISLERKRIFILNTKALHEIAGI